MEQFPMCVRLEQGNNPPPCYPALQQQLEYF
jgi:hypothetical protein